MEKRITPISFLRRNIYFIYCILQVGGILNRMLRNVDNTHLPIENQRYDISSIHVQQWLFKAYNEIKILIFQPLLKIFFLKTCLLLPTFFIPIFWTSILLILLINWIFLQDHTTSIILNQLNVKSFLSNNDSKY